VAAEEADRELDGAEPEETISYQINRLVRFDVGYEKIEDVCLVGLQEQPRAYNEHCAASQLPKGKAGDFMSDRFLIVR